MTQSNYLTKMYGDAGTCHPKTSPHVAALL